MSRDRRERGATPPGPPADAPPNPFVEMVRNPAARTYLIVSAAGLLVLCACLFLFFDSIGGAVLVLIVGGLGLAARWPASPPLVAAAVAWFTFTRIGLPLDVPPFNQIPGRQFDPTDLLLVAAALVYLFAGYRFLSAVRAGMPFDAPAEFVKPGAKATVRPPVPVRDAELWLLFARVAAAVLAGQVLWLVVTKLRVNFRKSLPVEPHPSYASEMGMDWEPGVVGNPLSRFLLLGGAFAAVGFAVWFALWYWRLTTLNRDEGRAGCVDAEWAANRRAYHLPEKWAGWTRKKLAGTLPRKGCGAWFLAVGLPLALVAVFGLIILCMGWK